MNDIDLSRQEGESELAYLWRLGELKYNGIIEMTWDELAEVLNRNLRDSEEEYLGSSAYRKRYSVMKQAKDEVFATDDSDVSLCEEIVALRQELEKERVKIRDERTAYRKLIREQARKETLDDLFIDSVNAINEKYPLINISSSSDFDTANGREAILCLSDWHYGMVTDNIWNKYNPQICRDRVNRVICFTRSYLKLNRVKRLHIALLGDLAHGMVQKCNIGSSKDVCDQIMEVAEIVAECINDLSSIVDEVTVYSCYGNHLRSAQNKGDALPSDNMEKIIPWWLEQRLKDNEKVSIILSNYKEYTFMKVGGYNIVCVHGNDFNFKDIGVISNSLFNKLFNVNIDYTISGDKHHFEEIEKFGIESILVSSLCGTDDYANSQRLYGKPGQTLMIFNSEYGRESTYHIPVD